MYKIVATNSAKKVRVICLMVESYLEARAMMDILQELDPLEIFEIREM